MEEIIYNLELILNKDKRFKKNGDNNYHKQIKKIYQKNNNLNQTIDITQLMNFNNNEYLKLLMHINDKLIHLNKIIDKIIK
jgi:hypothetical protein